MKINPKPHASKAFTLIELLVAMSIVILLAGMSIGGYKYVTSKQAQKKAEVQVQLLSQALEDYKLDKGTFPVSPSGTNVLYQALYWDTDSDGTGADNDTDQKFYLSELDPVNSKQGWIDGTGANVKILDPWGREYIYRSPGTINPDFDIISMGPDGLTSDNRSNQQNKDDVTN